MPEHGGTIKAGLDRTYEELKHPNTLETEKEGHWGLDRTYEELKPRSCSHFKREGHV